MYKEEDIIRAYEKARKGSKDYYEDFCTMMFDEVRRLVSLVYEKESNINKLVNHIFNKLRPRLGEFDPSKEDIHRWVSVFSSKMIYSVYNMSNSDVFTYREENSEYEIGYIEEDDEFAECAVYYNRVIASKHFNKADSVFSMLTKGQIILYELFCYAGCTVEEIEDMLEVDGVYICSELYDIKKMLIRELKETKWMSQATSNTATSGALVGGALNSAQDRAKSEDAHYSGRDEYDESDTSGYEADEYGDDDYDNSDEYDDESNYDDEEYDDESNYDGDEYDDESNYDDDEYDDESNYDDDEYDDDQDDVAREYETYLNGPKKHSVKSDSDIVSRKKSGDTGVRRTQSKKSRGFMGLFDGMSDKMIKLIAMCIVALILVVVLFMVVFWGGKKDNNKTQGGSNNNTHQEQHTGNNGPKETQAQTQADGQGESEGMSQSSSDNTETQSQTVNGGQESQGTQQQTQQTQSGNKETERQTQTNAPETTAPTEANNSDNTEGQTTAEDTTQNGESENSSESSGAQETTGSDTETVAPTEDGSNAATDDANGAETDAPSESEGSTSGQTDNTSENSDSNAESVSQ